MLALLVILISVSLLDSGQTAYVRYGQYYDQQDDDYTSSFRDIRRLSAEVKTLKKQQSELEQQQQDMIEDIQELLNITYVLKSSLRLSQIKLCLLDHS